MSGAIETGGPPFPEVVQRYNPDRNADETVSEGGMTLRDYFIAHAPAEPQPWFQPVMPPRPKHPGNRPKTIDLQNPGRIVSTPETVAYDAAIANFSQEMEGYLKEQTRQLYIQWPSAWADAMLKARKS